MNEKNKIILGISCGDINGVGLEILIKSFLNNDLFNFCTPILYVPQSVMNYYKKLYNFNNFNYHVINDPKNASLNQMNVIKFFNNSIEVTPGNETELGAQIALESMDLALDHLKKNKINLLLTLPVNKQNISLIKKDFIGHTEYLSQYFDNVDNLMLLCDDNLRVATVTNHIPLSKVPASITKEVLKKKIEILIKSLQIDFLISKPKIGVLSLNPHGGDNGLIGKEDLEIISPVIDSFFNNGYLVYGPYSADGFFGSGNYKNFDAILGMYHDQSLIPFKSMSFGSGVNYTAGLPVIRVSPDHGVGYDISGQGIAKIQSVLAAIFLGLKLYSNRKLYLEAIRKTE